MRNACKILRIDKNTAVCGFWMRREISIFLKLWQHDNHPSRPSPGLQPATRRWRAFVMPSFRPPLHPRSTLPPPRRVGLRFPTPVGHGRGLASLSGCAVRGKASVRLGFARLHPRPGNGGDAVPASPSAASRCSPSLATLSVCLCWCLTDSGGATAGQHCCHVHRRQPLAVVLRFARTRIYYARCLR